jgi:GxxExxY protein
LDCAYRADVIVDGRVLLELKAVERLMPIHRAQLLSYLRLTGLRTGLLLNFHVALLRDGLVRMVL